MHTTSRILHAIADRLLVDIQSDVIPIVFEEPPRLFSESACPLSSASCNTSCSSRLNIQTIRKQRGETSGLPTTRAEWAIRKPQHKMRRYGRFDFNGWKRVTMSEPALASVASEITFLELTFRCALCIWWAYFWRHMLSHYSTRIAWGRIEHRIRIRALTPPSDRVDGRAHG